MFHSLPLPAACLSAVLGALCVACSPPQPSQPPAPKPVPVPEPVPVRKPTTDWAGIKAILSDLTAWRESEGTKKAEVVLAIEPLLRGFHFDRMELFESGKLANRLAVFIHAETELEFVLVPGGSFSMGAPKSEKGRRDDELRHEVRLSNAFVICRTEVTQAVWESVMGDNPSKSKGDTLPVEQVSGHDVAKFLRATRLSLPTEAQWEYACRGGTKTRFAFGNTTSEAAKGAWTEENSGGATHPVAEKEANAFGLYDMHGNVFEWVADGFLDYAESPGVDPVGDGGSPYRANRGGSYANKVSAARSAFRYPAPVADRHGGLGFRPARTIRFRKTK